VTIIQSELHKGATMIFLKSLTFILWNVALGSILLYSTRWFLFNRKQRKFLGIKIPLTPGFLVRKRDWLFNKARDVLHDYLNQAAKATMKEGYLNKWEELVRQTVLEKTGFIDDWKLLPASFRSKIKETVATSVKEIIARILRKLVPHFIEKWRLEFHIDELDERFNIDFILLYFNKYVFKYLLLGFLILNFIIGLVNMIWYLIIH
jgi:hypothetical protein